MNYRAIILSFLFGGFCLPACERKSADQRVVHREGEPDVFNFESEDPEMNAAIAEAKRTTDSFLKILSDPKSKQTDFSAKRPYPTKGNSGYEHIWISNLSYDGKLLHGNISDEPLNIPNLKFDEAVSFPPDELSDWMYMEDKKVVGGYTVHVARKHMTAGEGAEFDRHIQFKQ
ncbi:MAG: DUF2314 domain-containing protein [Luteolibacter sp.]